LRRILYGSKKLVVASPGKDLRGRRKRERREEREGVMRRTGKE
jgi:hypothetical protein